MRFLSLVLAVFLCCAFPAAALHAAKITVKKGGAHPTVQSGIDLAGPGDTVLIKAGVYQENVVIPAGKDGLTVETKGPVIIEARPAGGLGAGPGISVDSEDVRIEALTIQNAWVHPSIPTALGYGVEGKKPGLTLKQVTVSGNEAAGIHVTGGAGTRIVSCAVVGNGAGVDVAGADVTVIGTTVSHSAGDGIYVDGAGARVTKCGVDNTASEAITVIGANAVVEQNTIYVVGSYAILVSGAGARITENKVRGSFGYGAYLNGADCVIEQNTIQYVFKYDGVFATGDNPTIKKNKISHVVADYDGIRVEGAITTGLIKGNTVVNASAHGIYVAASCYNITLTGNTVTGTGNGSDVGIYLRGNSHLVQENIVRDGAGDGFDISGNGILLLDNQARNNTRDGFDVAGGNGVIFRLNTATGNGAEGFDNGGTGTVIENNKAKNNRLDFANSGSVASFKDNTSGDGSNQNTLPEID